ncbi:MAG: hydroxymethylpyrimidine/phosphomethylpyrimidine kinase [Microbacteriaceae bacterium]|jgi:hydroxymethylpyrimidine/phosphomethylpyrimidine kinase|nr:hydroxymethylpyrimidine/phosphomethylpyrimidine kinase [Microbacteriaceae bacterium]
MIHNVLSIAGTDPSGGAGVQADLKTFSALGVYGMTVATALVAQNTRGVSAIHHVPADFLTRQLETLFEDVRVDAVKIGMLGTADTVRAVATALTTYRPAYVVLDPVMVASSGDRLLAANAISTLCEELLPVVDLVTPNLAEAAVLLGEDEATSEDEALAQLERLQALIPGILITGGHLGGDESVDLLAIDGSVTRLGSPRVQTRNTHGTGCTLSAAIAALRPQRPDWASAVSDAKDYVTGALRGADALEVGSGRGPLHHFQGVWSPGG